MLLTEKLQRQEKLSSGEKSVAEFLLTAGRRLSDCSTRSLAEATYTSAATVIRLCKKMGCSGFEELKAQYLKELDYLEQDFGEVDVNFPFSAGDSVNRMAIKMGQLYTETVKDTLALLKYNELHKAIRMIRACDTLYIFSAGTSLNMAEVFRERMMKLGQRVTIVNNLNYQLYEVNCIARRDCALILSYSGETAAMVKIAGICHERGVPLIALTSFGENSLTQCADCRLQMSSHESLFYNITDFSSHLSVYFLLDLLFGAFFLQDYDRNYRKKFDIVQENEPRRHSSNPYLNHKTD